MIKWFIFILSIYGFAAMFNTVLLSIKLKKNVNALNACVFMLLSLVAMFSCFD